MPIELLSGTDAEYRPGVGIMLLNDHGEVLVACRNDVSGQSWQMPQGGIEEGEDPRVTAFRELREEIGATDQDLPVPHFRPMASRRGRAMPTPVFPLPYISDILV